jgi:AcrR family transcriptional regulator
MVDEVGLSRLTLAALAGRLGVRQPSLYKHVDGMDDLQRSLALRAKHDLANVLARAAVGRERGDAIDSISHAYRAWALEHPGRYAAAQRAPIPSDSDDQTASHAVVQILADVLAGYQLREDDAIDAIRALRSALHGFVTLELGGGFGLPVDVDRSFVQLVRGLITALAHWTDDTTNESRR